MLRRVLRYSLLAFFVLLTAALAALSIRSFWAVDSIYYYTGKTHTPAHNWPYGTYIRLTYDRGWFYCYINNQRPPNVPRSLRCKAADPVPPVMFKPTDDSDYIVFAHTRLIGRPFISSYIDPAGRDKRTLEEHYIVTAWAPLTLTAAASFLFLFPARRAWRSTSRARYGLCAVCGYDLRAHQPGDRCPECGTVREITS